MEVRSCGSSSLSADDTTTQPFSGRPSASFAERQGWVGVRWCCGGALWLSVPCSCVPSYYGRCSQNLRPLSHTPVVDCTISADASAAILGPNVVRSSPHVRITVETHDMPLSLLRITICGCGQTDSLTVAQLCRPRCVPGLVVQLPASPIWSTKTNPTHRASSDNSLG